MQVVCQFSVAICNLSSNLQAFLWNIYETICFGSLFIYLEMLQSYILPTLALWYAINQKQVARMTARQSESGPLTLL